MSEILTGPLSVSLSPRTTFHANSAQHEYGVVRTDTSTRALRLSFANPQDHPCPDSPKAWRHLQTLHREQFAPISRLQPPRVGRPCSSDHKPFENLVSRLLNEFSKSCFRPLHSVQRKQPKSKCRHPVLGPRLGKLSTALGSFWKNRTSGRRPTVHGANGSAVTTSFEPAYKRSRRLTRSKGEEVLHFNAGSDSA